MKTSNKFNKESKPKILSSAIRVMNTQPIKCDKISKEISNSYFFFSPILLTKSAPIGINIKTTIKKPKSKDDKNTDFNNLSKVPIEIKSINIKPIENGSFVFQDQTSININTSQSNMKSSEKPPKPTQLDKPSIISLNTSSIPMQSNNNSIKPNADLISNYLNYHLGDTRNYTQLDEIELDSISKRKKIEINDTHTPSTNELEIDLSKASIEFESLIIGTKLNYQKQIDKTSHIKHIFPNNSVYHIDTNEVSLALLYITISYSMMKEKKRSQYIH